MPAAADVEALLGEFLLPDAGQQRVPLEVRQQFAVEVDPRGHGHGVLGSQVLGREAEPGVPLVVGVAVQGIGRRDDVGRHRVVGPRHERRVPVGRRVGDQVGRGLEDRDLQVHRVGPDREVPPDDETVGAEPLDVQVHAGEAVLVGGHRLAGVEQVARGEVLVQPAHVHGLIGRAGLQRDADGAFLVAVHLGVVEGQVVVGLPGEVVEAGLDHEGYALHVTQREGAVPVPVAVQHGYVPVLHRELVAVDEHGVQLSRGFRGPGEACAEAVLGAGGRLVQAHRVEGVFVMGPHVDGVPRTVAGEAETVGVEAVPVHHFVEAAHGIGRRPPGQIQTLQQVQGRPDVLVGEAVVGLVGFGKDLEGVEPGLEGVAAALDRHRAEVREAEDHSRRRETDQLFVGVFAVDVQPDGERLLDRGLAVVLQVEVPDGRGRPAGEIGRHGRSPRPEPPIRIGSRHGRPVDLGIEDQVRGEGFADDERAGHGVGEVEVAGMVEGAHRGVVGARRQRFAHVPGALEHLRGGRGRVAPLGDGDRVSGYARCVVEGLGPIEGDGGVRRRHPRSVVERVQIRGQIGVRAVVVETVVHARLPHVGPLAGETALQGLPPLQGRVRFLDVHDADQGPAVEDRVVRIARERRVLVEVDVLEILQKGLQMTLGRPGIAFAGHVVDHIPAWLDDLRVAPVHGTRIHAVAQVLAQQIGQVVGESFLLGGPDFLLAPSAVCAIGPEGALVAPGVAVFGDQGVGVLVLPVMAELVQVAVLVPFPAIGDVDLAEDGVVGAFAGPLHVHGAHVVAVISVDGIGVVEDAEDVARLFVFVGALQAEVVIRAAVIVHAGGVPAVGPFEPGRLHVELVVLAENLHVEVRVGVEVPGIPGERAVQNAGRAQLSRSQELIDAHVLVVDLVG